MFDIGWPELFIIAVVVLLVVGPKDLPKVLRTVGHFAGKAKAITREFRGHVDDMIRDSELEDVIKSSLLIQQIKEEAARRILLLAPQWKQQNALIDIYLFGKLERLDEQQQARLQEAEALLQSIQDIRQRSDEIEASFLKGVAVEYLTDQAWESDHA